MMEEQIGQLVDKVLETHPGIFRVDIRIKPTNNVKVFLDGDEGLPIEQCVKINRELYKVMVEAGLYPDGEFSLEVSSPGVDEPLKFYRQYAKHTGRKVRVIFNDGTQKEGKLLQATEKDILLEETSGKGKKAETRQLVIPFDHIKSTTVQIQF